MALGADASNVMRLVMSYGLALTAGGVVLGRAGGTWNDKADGKPAVSSEPSRPAGVDGRLAVMTIASLAACFLPAGRATRTDQCGRCETESYVPGTGIRKRVPSPEVFGATSQNSTADGALNKAFAVPA